MWSALQSVLRARVLLAFGGGVCRQPEVYVCLLFLCTVRLDHRHDTLHKGVVAAIVVGCLILLLLLGGNHPSSLLHLEYTRHKSQK